jgi:hypothetical protein
MIEVTKIGELIFIAIWKLGNNAQGVVKMREGDACSSFRIKASPVHPPKSARRVLGSLPLIPLAQSRGI